MINDIKNKLIKNNKFSYKSITHLTEKEIAFINEKTEFLNKYLIDFDKKLKIKNKFHIRIYCLLNNIKEVPVCLFEECDNQTLFGRSYSNGFNEFCCIKCSSKNNTKEVNYKVIDTDYIYNVDLLMDYFSKNINKSKQIQFRRNSKENIIWVESIKKLLNVELEDNAAIYIFITEFELIKQGLDPLEKYRCKLNGCNKITGFINYSEGFRQYCSLECTNKDEELTKKVRETNLKKYGHENPFGNKDVQAKIKKTNLDKYGEEIASKSEIVKEKMIKTNQKLYGGNSPLCSAKVKKTMKQNFIKRWGVESPMHLKEVLEKQKKKMFKKYGVPYYFMTEECKERNKAEAMKKYGVTHHSKAEEIKNKIRNTNLKKIGYVSNLCIIDNYKKELNRKTYGVDFNQQKHMLNYQNYNKEYIEKTFVKNGLLDFNSFLKYFNITYSTGYKTLKTLGINYERTKNNKSKAEVELHKIFRPISDSIKTNDKSKITPYELDIYMEKGRKK
jgi:hypothetical protein